MELILAVGVTLKVILVFGLGRPEGTGLANRTRGLSAQVTVPASAVPAERHSSGLASSELRGILLA
jgi:hypothetical protein